ncbi:IS1182 family transposase [Spirillospora sp. CA-128828]|uniref:IS1182 family transposase n=1 Tax=Spirillospora sp. CA-128828 TaxID=3240033 RepID=UPI003D8DBA9C
MSVRPRSGVEIPELTARVARASNPKGTAAMWVRDRLDGLWSDEDFVAWYPRDGRAGISPAQLATVSVLQFLHNLSDRQAAEAVCCRIDFKYALGLELDDPGFHHSVLGDFRERLAREGRADALLDLALERLKAAGLVRERGRQRTDSTRILSAARVLTRLELVLETVRAAVEEVARTAPEVLDGLVTAEWGERYGRQVRMCSQPSRPVSRLTQAGLDAHALLTAVGAQTPWCQAGRQVRVLRQVLLQQFYTDAGDRLRPRDEKAGLPPAGRRIQSPYDTDARYVSRNDTKWTGYLAHVTETCDDEGTNVITDVATLVSAGDIKALPGIHQRLAHRRLLPAQHLVDAGYTSAVAIDDTARAHNTELVGPLAARGPNRHRKQQTGFAREDFAIDFDHRTVTCPNGKVTANWVQAPAMAPYLVARFHKNHCAPCPDRSRCTSGASPRTINFLPRHLHQIQAKNRADQHDPAWLRLYHSRSGVEGTVNEIVNGHRMRRCRYHQTAKVHLQHVLTAIAINIQRLSEQDPDTSTYRPRPPTAFQQYLQQREFPRPMWWRQGK